MVTTYSHAIVQGQRSVGYEDRVETNRWTNVKTDGGNCITSLANAVGSNKWKTTRQYDHIIMVVTLVVLYQVKQNVFFVNLQQENY